MSYFGIASFIFIILIPTVLLFRGKCDDRCPEFNRLFMETISRS